ncbi:DnaJ -like subfamily C member 2 [Nematocida displodere]|uniref:DnaJ-like subfamily C member 2 n=1 Tax=Nematocida displodere TaxID=1805483 RepID=A0A177EEN8_9MICR|nr:DnaJ -like subfamily C member 2 [Nematocida displodere]
MSITLYTGKKTAKAHCGPCRAPVAEIIKKPSDLFAKYTLDQIKNWKCLDLYSLMGLSQEGSSSLTEAQFKNAYRAQAKLFHPDMLTAYKIDDGGASFIALTRAHQTLSNPIKKKQYDCVVFDETMPEDREYLPEEFFAAFSEVFDRNSIYSVKPYKVSLGDLETTSNDLSLFYKFWQSFESSRSFEFLCEDEDCLNRDARRHVARQNKETLDQKKSEDNLRIRKLVNMAIKHDPRLKKKNAAPAKPVTVGADGWKSTEVDALTKLAKTYPASTKNRVDVIFTMFARFFNTRQKREVHIKLVKIDAELKKPAK